MNCSLWMVVLAKYIHQAQIIGNTCCICFAVYWIVYSIFFKLIKCMLFIEISSDGGGIWQHARAYLDSHLYFYEHIGVPCAAKCKDWLCASWNANSRASSNSILLDRYRTALCSQWYYGAHLYFSAILSSSVT